MKIKDAKYTNNLLDHILKCEIELERLINLTEEHADSGVVFPRKCLAMLDLFRTILYIDLKEQNGQIKEK